jgi:hypothetical protein
MNRRRPFRALLFVLVALLALGAAASAAAEIREVSIEIHPIWPTWQEEVTIIVRGEASCLVEVFDTSAVIVPGTGSVLRVELEEACPIDPSIFMPFEVTAQVGTMVPGARTVQVTPAGQAATVLAAAPLTVFDLAALAIGLPAQPVTDAAPFVVTLTGFSSSCQEPSPVEVIGNVILIEFPEGCPILAPPPVFETFEYLLGPLPAGDYEVRVVRSGFPELGLAKAAFHVFDAQACLPENDVLCLGDDRFAVRVQWTDFEGNSGVGQAMPLLDDTGLFWFFRPDNVELTIKVIDACGPFGNFWVFVASGSTVEYEIRVTDTASDPEQTNVYRNALGQVPSLIADTGAFLCP